MPDSTSLIADTIIRTVELDLTITGAAIDERHTAVDVTHWTYQDIIAAYEHPDRRVGKRWMYKIMCRIRKDLPAGVQELGQLGRTMWKRRAEILAYFDTSASNGPVEAINGRLDPAKNATCPSQRSNRPNTLCANPPLTLEVIMTTTTS